MTSNATFTATLYDADEIQATETIAVEVAVTGLENSMQLAGLLTDAAHERACALWPESDPTDVDVDPFEGICSPA